MELKHFLQPTEVNYNLQQGIMLDECLGSKIGSIEEDLCDGVVAIISVEESINSIENKGCEQGPYEIKKHLYGLKSLAKPLKVVDLGVVLGKSLKDKYKALEEVIKILIDKGVVILVLGGSQELTLFCHKGLCDVDQYKNVTLVDSTFDDIPESDDFSSINYVSSMINADKKIRMSLVGLQKYLIGNKQEEFIKENNFQLIRLGQIRSNGLKSTEPILRDSDMVSLDISSIKYADMPAQSQPMPNGLNSEEICQMGWFSGMSDRLKLFSLFELNPKYDSNETGAMLGAQIIWHFLEGVSNRNEDYPKRDIESYHVYYVALEELDLHIRFFCNKENDRWWVELPTAKGSEIVACGENDYHMFKENKIPDKWLVQIYESSCKSAEK